MWDFIEKVVYINLESRSDRRERMENMTKTFGDKVIRQDAVLDTNNRAIGCTKSHIKVIEMAIEKGWSSVLVLEDDATWNNIVEGYRKLEVLVRDPYDVIVLGGSAITWDQPTLRLKQAQTTTAYLVSKEYMHTLLENYKEGLRLFGETGDSTKYAIDVYWNNLIKRDNWYVVIPVLIYQPDWEILFLKEFMPYQFARGSWPYLIDHGSDEQKKSIADGTFFEKSHIAIPEKPPARKFTWNNVYRKK
jgi:glycosyl transferase family 25